MTLGCPSNLALGHLLVCLRPLQRALRGAVAQREAAGARLRAAGAVADAITAGHAAAVLDQLDDLIAHVAFSTGAAEPTAEERALEAQLRERAARDERRLPLDALAADLGLDRFEREVLVLAMASELDREFDAVVAFIHDDAARRRLSVELACGLTATSLHDRVARRHAFGEAGRLRRLGLIDLHGSGLTAAVTASPRTVEVLLGAAHDAPLVFRDPAAVAVVPPPVVPADEALVARAAAAMAAGRLDVLAVWGRAPLARDVVVAVAAGLDRPLRRFPAGGVEIVTALTTAAALGAVLWIDGDAVPETASDDVVAACRATRVPLLWSAAQPFRPTGLLADRAWVELAVVEPSLAERRVVWSAALPEAGDGLLDDVALGFRFDATTIRAAARATRATAALHTNGHLVTADDCLRDVCGAVARQRGERHTTLVVARRRPDELVLPPDVHRRVLDLIAYYRAMPVVMDDWGFARRVTGGGLKALFTGDSGTGKTMAAEVVAGQLGLPLLKVDLARVVSKWIGETEKNLDVAFREAEDSHAVLFFDEAEALFGARGEVRHGTDRYANLEVSYLLQRLEDHAGVVILASNLRDKIDPAFIRRFHAVIAFPRPTERERRRLWQGAFPPAVPVADLDVPALSRLDLTGAGIIGAAQTAALLAVHEGATTVTMAHVVRGLARQFHRESRVLTAHDLGAHGALLGAS